MNHLKIEMLPGKHAPRYYRDVTQLDAEKVVVTENGMESGLPLVDFQLVDKHGKKYFFMITGRLINAVSAAIKGANMRNHGREEP